ncbi:hypothetical protein, partial [Thermogutta sp.]|uniref:hypothetical protein n=1 Tax=Thermogutta sp. TaxID=1962930 RepID=UPI0032202F16
YNSDTEKRPSLYYGTGYSNGALVDQRTALIITSDLYGSHWCIVGAVTVAYLAKSAQSTQCAWFITKADDVSNTEIIGAVRTSSGTSNIYWTNGHVTAYIASLSILGVSAGLLTSDGQYYLRAKPVVVSSTGALLSTSLSDLWILCRPASFVGGIEIYGDDVVLCSGSVTNPAAYNVQPLYVVGGNI